MTQYLTPRQFIAKHTWATNGGMRHYLFYGETNGLNKSGAILRIGRKILINEEKFFEWIETLNKSNSGGNHE